MLALAVTDLSHCRYSASLLDHIISLDDFLNKKNLFSLRGLVLLLHHSFWQSWIVQLYQNNQKTRPDTRQDSRGRLGRSRNVKTARNLEIFPMD